MGRGTPGRLPRCHCRDQIHQKGVEKRSHGNSTSKGQALEPLENSVNKHKESEEEESGSTTSSRGSNIGIIQLQLESSAFASPQFNLFVAGMSFTLMTSAKSPPYEHFFTVAIAVGFFASLFAVMYGNKNPEFAKVLSKIGVIGATSAVCICLEGFNVFKDTNSYLNLAVTSAASLSIAVVVVMAD